MGKKKQARPAGCMYLILAGMLSVILLVFVRGFLGFPMLLAIPLSKTNPRRGRYSKLFPSIILYLIYLVLLNAAKGALEEGKLPTNLGLWWVHGVFLLLASVLWIDKNILIHKFNLNHKNTAIR